MTLHSDNNLFVSQRAVEMGAPVKPDLIIMDGRISFVSGGPAIGLAVQLADPADGVLVAGKGHEDYQILGATRRHFDDREEVRAALKLRGR